MTRLVAVLLAAACAYAAETPSPALLVLNKEDATLAIVNPKSSTVVARIPTGDQPHEVAVSEDGRLAFVCNYGSGQNPGRTVSVIDLVAQKEHRVDLGPLQRPHGAAFAGGKFYFTAEANKVIGRFDPEKNQVDWILGTGQNTTHMVLPSKDLSRIFTANIGSDSISLFERGSNPMNWNQTVIPVGKGPEAIDLSPDGREVWTAHSGDGGVSIIDVAAKKVAATIDVHTKRSNRLKFTPDGKHVLITDLAGGELIVVDAAARKEIKRVGLGRNPEGILIEPGGLRAFVAVAGDNQISIVDLSSWEITGHIKTGAGPDGMAWKIR